MSVYLGAEKISVYTGGIIVKNSGQYVWSKQESETGPIIEYVTGDTESDYPDGGWQDGAWYKMFQAEYISENISGNHILCNSLAGSCYGCKIR